MQAEMVTARHAIETLIGLDRFYEIEAETVEDKKWASASSADRTLDTRDLVRRVRASGHPGAIQFCAWGRGQSRRRRAMPRATPRLSRPAASRLNDIGSGTDAVVVRTKLPPPPPPPLSPPKSPVKPAPPTTISNTVPAVSVISPLTSAPKPPVADEEAPLPPCAPAAT